MEPALVGAMIAINLGQTSLQNFYLRTACTVDLGKNMSVCDRGVGEDFRAAEVSHKNTYTRYVCVCNMSKVLVYRDIFILTYA